MEKQDGVPSGAHTDVDAVDELSTSSHSSSSQLQTADNDTISRKANAKKKNRAGYAKRRPHAANPLVLVQKPLLENPEKPQGWDFYRKVLNNPKYIAAPMVDTSLLPWRLLCRRYGTHLAYTPMIHSKSFSESRTYRGMYFSSCPDDRPLIAQFCANQADVLLDAARYVDGHCDAVDLNIGCPQYIARRGGYGAFLMDGDWEVVSHMVRVLHKHLSVPVTCKMRLLPDLDRTIAFAKMLQASGCQMLVVHGRTKEQKGQRTGLADWTAIRAVRDALEIPVVANGNIRYLEDVDKCLQATGAAGVMSAEAVLKNPAFFAGGEASRNPNMIDLARQYVELSMEFPQDLKFLKGLIQKLCRPDLDNYYDLKAKIATSRNMEGIADCITELKMRVETAAPFVLQPEAEKAEAVDLGDSLMGLGVEL